MKDYYALLGLDRKATKAEIKKNYRQLATKYHPDKSKDPNSAGKFIAITEAYDVLSNKKSRTQYDLFVWEKLKRNTETANTFTTVVPPYESTRSRRNKAQKKRSIKYHQASKGSNKFFLLIKESLYITSRYIFHILAATLLCIILYSITSQFSEIIETGLLKAVLTCAAIAAIAYGIIKIGENLFVEYQRDIQAFAVYYKIPLTTATSFSIFISSLTLITYTLAVIRYF